MPLTWRYVNFYRGDNECLVGDPPTDQEELAEFHMGWARLRKDCEHHIEITEDMYTNGDGDTPEWIELTIQDEGLLALKMARGVVQSMEGAHAMSFDKFFDVAVSEEWGNVGFARLYICGQTAYINIYGNGDNEELELIVTQQIDKAIGE